MVAWPKLPKAEPKNKFQCKYCKIRFRSRQALGGHTSKSHPGRSTTFTRSMIRRDERVNERYVHKLAKDIFHALNQNALDVKTYQTFKWQRRRLALYEKAALLDDSTGYWNAHTIKQKKESDKGRVRKLKVKVWKIIKKPYSQQQELIGPEWLERFQHLELSDIPNSNNSSRLVP